MIISQVQQPFETILEPQQREQIKAEEARQINEQETVKETEADNPQAREREPARERPLEEPNLGNNFDETA